MSISRRYVSWTIGLKIITNVMIYEYKRAWILAHATCHVTNILSKHMRHLLLVFNCYLYFVTSIIISIFQIPQLGPAASSTDIFFLRIFPPTWSRSISYVGSLITWPRYTSIHLLIVIRIFCALIIFLRTSTLVTLSTHEIYNILRLAHISNTTNFFTYDVLWIHAFTL